MIGITKPSFVSLAVDALGNSVHVADSDHPETSVIGTDILRKVNEKDPHFRVSLGDKASQQEPQASDHSNPPLSSAEHPSQSHSKYYPFAFAPVEEQNDLPEFMVFINFGRDDLALLPHSIQHLLRRLDVSPDAIFIIFNKATDTELHAARKIVERAGIPEGNIMTWDGTYSSSARAAFVAGVVNQVLESPRWRGVSDLWLGLWDADEFPLMQIPYHTKDTGQRDSIRRKLQSHGNKGYNVLGGVLVDRVAEGGDLKDIADEGINGDIFMQYPNECTLTGNIGWVSKGVAVHRTYWHATKARLGQKEQSAERGGHHLPFFVGTGGTSEAHHAQCQHPAELIEVAHFKWTSNLKHKVEGYVKDGRFQANATSWLVPYLTSHGGRIDIEKDCRTNPLLSDYEECKITCFHDNMLLKYGRCCHIGRWSQGRITANLVCSAAYSIWFVSEHPKAAVSFLALCVVLCWIKIPKKR